MSRDDSIHYVRPCLYRMSHFDLLRAFPGAQRPLTDAVRAGKAYIVRKTIVASCLSAVPVDVRHYHKPEPEAKLPRLGRHAAHEGYEQ